MTEANDHFDEFYGIDRLMARVKENEDVPLNDQNRQPRKSLFSTVRTFRPSSRL